MLKGIQFVVVKKVKFHSHKIELGSRDKSNERKHALE